MFNFSCYEDLYKLKNILRKGWLDHNLPSFGLRCESDAEHIFSCMFMAVNIAKSYKLKIDVNKVLKMLLFHEVGECEIGDITPFDGVTINQKHNMEDKAVKNFALKHEMPEVYSLWCEFEERKTDEAKFCYVMDKLDAVVQSKIYANEINNQNLFNEFYNNTKNRLGANCDNYEFLFNNGSDKFNLSCYEDLYKLKTILRKGWLNRNINKNNNLRIESDAEHIFSSMFMAANIISNKKLKLNLEKVLLMLLYHEVGECAVGDITPFDGITVEQKHSLEAKAVKQFSKKHNLPEIYEIWSEFEERKTDEAKFCYAIDKLDAVMQSKMYDNVIGNNNLFTEFYNYEKIRLKDFDDFKFLFK